MLQLWWDSFFFAGNPWRVGGGGTQFFMRAIFFHTPPVTWVLYFERGFAGLRKWRSTPQLHPCTGTTFAAANDGQGLVGVHLA